MTQAEDANPDDDRFGIDLGPRHAVDEPGDADDAEPAPARQPTRTLAQRLAAAAADRDNADPPTSEPD